MKQLFTSALLLSLLVMSMPVSALDAYEMLQRGHEMRRAGNFEKAIEFYEKTLAIDPNDSAAKNSLKSANRLKEIADFVKKYEPDCRKKTRDIEIAKHCLKKYFLFDGKPIHPLIIKDLLTWVSDVRDQVVAINLEGSQGSNRYCCEHSFRVKEVNKKMEVVIDLANDFSSQQEKDCSKYWECKFYYRFEGTTDSGVSLVRTWNRSGGSAIFSSLLFLKVKERNAVYKMIDGKFTWNKKQVILEKFFQLGLGDREAHTVEVDGDFLILNGERIGIGHH